VFAQDRSKRIFVTISLLGAISLWYFVQNERRIECQNDKNSYEDCHDLIKHLE